MRGYDSGFGGWRGEWGGPFSRGFPHLGGFPDEWPEGGDPRGGGFHGDWSREQGGGGPPRGFGARPDPRGGGWRGYDRGYGRPPRPPVDRGQYGGAYEEYGGHPGGPARGESYGGRARPSQGRGYDQGYAREPFMPDEAYRRHPEYRQERRPRAWEAHQHEYGLELDDDDVQASVRRRMECDAWLDPARIDVRVEDGVVTLTGEVDDYLEARYAWDDAWEADGVRGVVNNLTVRADQPHDAHGDVLSQSADGGTTADELSAS